MLEDGTLAVHLGRAAELALAHPQVGTLLGRQAHRAGRTDRPSCRATAASTPSRASPRDERAREMAVDRVDGAGGPDRGGAAPRRR